MDRKTRFFVIVTHFTFLWSSKKNFCGRFSNSSSGILFLFNQRRLLHVETFGFVNYLVANEVRLINYNKNVLINLNVSEGVRFNRKNSINWRNSKIVLHVSFRFILVIYVNVHRTHTGPGLGAGTRPGSPTE